MKISFKDVAFKPETLAVIEKCEEIIDDYQAQDIMLTVRQLYYRMIALDYIPNSWIDRAYNKAHGLDGDTKNTQKNYKRLGSIVGEARLGGMLDWAALEDRTREPDIPATWTSPTDLMDNAVRAYALDRWDGQDCYVELWGEKDTLASIIEPVAREFQAPLQINRGYSSLSAMYQASIRFKETHRDRVILYVGDHDPSGEDMVRDVRDRLSLFGVDVQVEKIALTMAQVQVYRPAPNPAKRGDSRHRKYVEEHGTKSWEVEALRPDVTRSLIREGFRRFIDAKKMDKIIRTENRQRRQLKRAAKAIK